MREFLIREIKWDTEVEGEVVDPIRLGLPSEVFIADKILAKYCEDFDDENEVDEAITSYLSDTYGYCVFSWEKAYISIIPCDRLMDIAYNAITLLEDTSCGLGLSVEELCDELGMSKQEYNTIINS